MDERTETMRLLRLVILLVVVGVIALVGYAYFGDMASDSRQMRVPVQLDLEVPAAPPQAAAAAPAPPAAAAQTSDPDALD